MSLQDPKELQLVHLPQSFRLFYVGSQKVKKAQGENMVSGALGTVLKRAKVRNKKQLRLVP